MSPLPTRMANRWQDRAEPEPGRGTIYWHMLVGQIPEVQSVAQEAQNRLAEVTELHMTPLQWLHITVLIVGSTEDVSVQQKSDLIAEASRLLAAVPAIKVSLGRILYHPEAVMLGIHPQNALKPVFYAVQSATQNVLDIPGLVESGKWTPHITVAYSTADQPAGPIIASLGRELPSQEITISSVSLVVQDGPERDWNWHPVGRVDFGSTVVTL